MKTYKIHEAKTNLSKLLQMVEEGETVYISRGKDVIAELKPVEPSNNKMPWGMLAENAWIADDWDSDETNQEIAKFLDDPILPE